ncbi:MAG: hypothetical protein IKI00_02360 [Bacteroidales bacterium]|nr:hypothetical protein [Bacteroidales bacterium]
MFSFRTTALEDQLDKALLGGRVGCFCTQNCWDTARGRYMYDLFRERGNLKAVFSPMGAELTPGTNTSHSTARPCPTWMPSWWKSRMQEHGISTIQRMYSN